MEALASGKLVFQIKASGHAAAIKVGLLPVSCQLQLYFYFCANTSTFTATCTNDNAGQKYTVTESRSDKDSARQCSSLSEVPYLCLEIYIIGTPGIFRILRLSSLSTVATM